MATKEIQMLMTQLFGLAPDQKTLLDNVVDDRGDFDRETWQKFWAARRMNFIYAASVIDPGMQHVATDTQQEFSDLDLAYLKDLRYLFDTMLSQAVETAKVTTLLSLLRRSRQAEWPLEQRKQLRDWLLATGLPAGTAPQAETAVGGIDVSQEPSNSDVKEINETKPMKPVTDNDTGSSFVDTDSVAANSVTDSNSQSSDTDDDDAFDPMDIPF